LQGIYGVSLLQKNGVFKNICDFLRIYIFRVVSREGREGAKVGKKRTAKYAEYANKKLSRNHSIQPQMDADERRWKGPKAKDGGCRLNYHTAG